MPLIKLSFKSILHWAPCKLIFNSEIVFFSFNVFPNFKQPSLHFLYFYNSVSINWIFILLVFFNNSKWLFDIKFSVEYWIIVFFYLLILWEEFSSVEIVLISLFIFSLQHLPLEFVLVFLCEALEFLVQNHPLQSVEWSAASLMDDIGWMKGKSWLGFYFFFF